MDSGSSLIKQFENYAPLCGSYTSASFPGRGLFKLRQEMQAQFREIFKIVASNGYQIDTRAENPELEVRELTPDAGSGLYAQFVPTTPDIDGTPKWDDLYVRFNAFREDLEQVGQNSNIGSRLLESGEFMLKYEADDMFEVLEIIARRRMDGLKPIEPHFKTMGHLLERANGGAYAPANTLN